MSRQAINPAKARKRDYVPVLTALADQTRLSIVGKLSNGQPHSIAQLTEGTGITRQAITKHLHVLESAGIVHGIKSGRENLFEFNPEPIVGVKEYLDYVSEQWDKALARLKDFVE